MYDRICIKFWLILPVYISKTVVNVVCMDVQGDIHVECTFKFIVEHLHMYTCEDIRVMSYVHWITYADIRMSAHVCSNARIKHIYNHLLVPFPKFFVSVESV